MNIDTATSPKPIGTEKGNGSICLAVALLEMNASPVTCPRAGSIDSLML